MNDRVADDGAFPAQRALRVGFAGTPEFAAVALQAILDAGYPVPLVLTQPDRPAGRGLKLQASVVKQLALGRGIAVAQPHSLRLDGKYAADARAAQAVLQAAALDVLVVAAYGLILPQWVLDTPTYGCLNIHGSLLPRWRGAAPIHRAIEAGDSQTGITIMQMDAGLDTGAMLNVAAVPISSTATTGQMHDVLAALGGRLMVQTLADLVAGTLQPVVQPSQGATYASKVDKAQAQLDWSSTAAQLVRQVRAFNPFPGAATTLNGEVVKIWECYEISSIKTPPVLDIGAFFLLNEQEIIVQTGAGLLGLGSLQRAGGRRCSAQEFARSTGLASHPSGTLRFCAPPTAIASAPGKVLT